MEITLTINGTRKSFVCSPGDTLFKLLRREGYYSVRYASETGETGAAAVLVDSPVLRLRFR